MMIGEKRRASILAELTKATAPINATNFAEMHGVTRQIIVADIALLRAAGNNIRAEHKGYVLDRNTADPRIKIVCRHSKEQTADELYAIVDNGGKVLDVQVEHSLYGILSGDLAIASRYEADEFIRESNETGAAQLSDLTGGVHIHTVSAKDADTLQRIQNKLTELGILVVD